MNEHFKYVYVKCLYKMHVRCYIVKCEMCNEKLGNNRYAGVPKILYSYLILHNKMYVSYIIKIILSKMLCKQRLTHWVHNFLSVKNSEDVLVDFYTPLDNYVRRNKWRTMKTLNKLQKIYNGNILKHANIKILSTNIPGILSIVDQEAAINQILFLKSPDLLFLNEINSKSVETMSFVGYEFVSGANPKIKGKQRICCLIKDNITYERLQIPCQVANLGIKIDKYQIYGIYREWCINGSKDSRKVEEQSKRYEEFVKKWSKLKTKWNIVLGDMNWDPRLLEERTQHQKNLEPLREITEDLILSHGWYQLIKNVTRTQKMTINGKTTIQSSLLDHIYIQEPNVVKDISNENVTGFDHNSIGLTVMMTKAPVKPKILELRKIASIPPDAFEREYFQCLGPVYRARDVNKAVELLEFAINRALDIVAPLKKIQTRINYAPWMTEEILSKLKLRDSARKKAIKTGDPEDWEDFKFLRKNARNLCNSQKAKYDKEYLSVEDSTQQWKRIKRYSGMEEREKKELEIMIEGEKTSDPVKTSNFMNSFFKSKVTKLIDQLSPDVNEACEYMRECIGDKKVGNFSFYCIEIEKMSKLISSLKNTKSVGVDCIQVQVLKQYNTVLAPAFTHIANLAIMSCTFPERYKFGQICPLPKKGNLLEPKNWRPINLLPIASKLIEGVMNYQLKDYLESWELFSPSQHAYRANRGTVSCWLDIDTIVRTSLEKGRMSLILTTDLSAAFNTLQKHIMIPMMRLLGVDALSAKLLESYLSGRKTQVKVGGVLSDIIELEAGVGEGSIQGPLAFISILIPVPIIAKRTNQRLKDIGVDAQAFTVEFADDCTGIIDGAGEVECQIAAIVMYEEFSKFYNTVGLKMNEQKSEILPIRKKPQTFQIRVGEVVETTRIKLLGLHVQANFRFEDHAKITCAVARSRLTEISKVAPYLPFQTLKRTVESLVLTKLYYAVEIYAVNQSILTSIQRVINSACRVVCGGDYSMKISDGLLRTNWLNSSNKVSLTRLMLLRKLLVTRCSKFTWSKIIRGSRHERVTRSQDLELTEYPTSYFGKLGVLANSVKLYNLLKLYNVNILSKQSLKKYLPPELKRKFGNSSKKLKLNT